MKHDIFKRYIEDLLITNIINIDDLIIDFDKYDFKVLKDIFINSDTINLTSYSLDLIFSYLFIQGYITETIIENEYKIPNKKIKSIFIKLLKGYYNTIFTVEPEKFSQLAKILNVVLEQTSDIEIKNIFEKQFNPTFTMLLKK